MREHGVKAVYTRPASYLSFYGQRDPLVVNPYNEGKARDSFLADLRIEPLILADRFASQHESFGPGV